MKYLLIALTLMLIAVGGVVNAERVVHKDYTQGMTDCIKCH